MTRRWTPRRFVARRRIRVLVCALVITLASVLTFGVAARKTVALTVNGQTKTINTYANSVPRLLEEQHVTVRTHDQVLSSSGDTLSNHAVVDVRSAYQTTINIDGKEVPFWTVATSADQLLGFFNKNLNNASRVKVDIKNVYNTLTGGLVIDRKGPVTVIADGKTSVAPNGKLPAASILDSKGITLGREDRVSVENDHGRTVLRVQHVTHRTVNATKVIPFSTRTVVDDALSAGQTVVRKRGHNGSTQQTFRVTLVDGKEASRTLVTDTVGSQATDEVIATGPKKSSPGTQTPSGKSSDSASATPTPTATSPSHSQTSASPTAAPTTSGSSSSTAPSPTRTSEPSRTPHKTSTPSATRTTPRPSQTRQPSSAQVRPTPRPSTTHTSTPAPRQTTTPTTVPTVTPQPSGRLWHPTVSQAQTYAAGAAAQRGWTGSEWTALVWLWNHESSWVWYAANPSGAYGIPQALPGSKMGAGWHDDGAVQIDWGLEYIAESYGSPNAAVRIWKQQGWY